MQTIEAAARPGVELGRPALILAICCLSMLLVGMDVTIVNVALPAIRQNLQASLPDLQWVVDAYTIVVASLLLFMGSLSDRFGRRRVFQLGLTLFTLASVLCSFAPDIHVLIACRLLQGLGASMLNPVALSIIANSFPDPRARAGAIGIWGAVAGLALGLGPLIGGALTQTAGWRWIFLINLPIGIAAVVLAACFVPESKAARARAIDPVGQGLVVIGLACLSYGLIEGPRLGWHSLPILALFAAAAAAVAGILLYEPRIPEPLLQLRFFRSVPFSGATIIAVAAFGSFASLLFLNALYLQGVRGFSPFETGLCTLPLALMTLVCGPASGRLVGRYGTRPSLLTAGVTMLTGALLLTPLRNDSPLWLLLLAYTVFGIGFGMVNPAVSTVAVAGMPRSQAGVAAAIASTSRQVGASLGVAIAGAVVSAGRAQGADFARSTHPMWWAMAGCAATIVLLGWATNTDWAQESAREAALPAALAE